MQYLLIIVSVLFTALFRTNTGIPISETQKLIFKIFDFPPNETTTCVPYYLCDSRINDSVPLIDVRSSNKECPHYLDRPCNITYQKLSQKVLQPSPPAAITDENRKTPSKLQCGNRNVNGIDFKIVENGYECQFGEFPWMVAVIKSSWLTPVLGTGMTQCDGTLIHPQVVLTTANCVFGYAPIELQIRAGDWDTLTDAEPSSFQERTITQIIIHENYTANNTILSDNYALLVLSKPVILNDYISAICLPTKDDLIDKQNCIAMGWGPDLVTEGDETKQHILKQYSNRALNVTQCEKFIQQHPTSTIQHSLPAVCTTNNTEITDCWGDIGNVLVCPQTNGQYVQIGLKSADENCKQKTKVFGSVNHYVDWIDTKINALNLNAKDSSISIHINNKYILYQILFIFCYYLFK